MSIFEAIILGLIQGLTEFLPVSSSGHLAIVPFLFGWEQQSLSFDVLVHGATLLAILIFYRRKIWSILTATLSKDPVSRKNNLTLTRNIILTSIPTTVIALLLKSNIEEASSSIPIIAAMLIIVGILLVYLDRMFKDTTTNYTLTGKSAVFIGLMQSLAFIRGTSRSGITIIAGAISGLSKEDAVDYAFLVSIPVLAGSFGLTVIEVINAPAAEESVGALIAGFVTAFVSGYLAITFLLRFIRTNSFAVFGYYRIILGIILLLLGIWAG